MKIEEIPTPFYIVYEEKLRRNLELISRVKQEAGVNIIMAFKANALKDISYNKGVCNRLHRKFAQ